MCARNAIRARDLVVEFAARGQYHFTSSEFRSALGVSVAAANQSLWRLAKRGEIASPGRGFYVIVPPEYRGLGCLPPDQFVPALMEHRGTRYYVGLLSAAQYHGAAHQRPQVFQVMVEKARKPIRCGTVGVDFIGRARLANVPLTTFESPRGAVLASTVEATAVDLVGFMGRAGGVDRIAGILLELSEQMDPGLLVEAAGPRRYCGRSDSGSSSSSLARARGALRSKITCNSARATTRGCCHRRRPRGRRVRVIGDCSSTPASRWKRDPARLRDGMARERALGR